MKDPIIFRKTVVVLLLFLILTVACQGTSPADPVQASGNGQDTNGFYGQPMMDPNGNVIGYFFPNMEYPPARICNGIISVDTQGGVTHTTGASISCP